MSRERMVQASIAGHANDPAMMRRLFDEISDPVRVAAIEKATRALDRQAFPWNDHYIATTEPGHAVEVILAGIAGDQFMARTTNAILVGQSRDLPAPAPERGERFGLAPSAWH